MRRNAVFALLLGLASSVAGAAPGPAGESREADLAASGPYALAGRSRLEMRFGLSDLRVSHNGWTDAVDVAGGDFSLSFVHWAHESFAFDLTLGASNVDFSSRQTRAGERVRSETLYRLMAGGRVYLPIEGAFRPHVMLAVGALSEMEVRDDPWHTDVTARATKVGLEVGGGVDFLFGTHFVLGVHAGAIVREGHRGRPNVGCNLGWTF
jgi:hypothetical protein